MIMIANVMPFVGAAIGIMFYFFGLLLPPRALEDMQLWADDVNNRGAFNGRCKGCCCGPRCRTIFLNLVYPALLWRTFLRDDDAFNWVARWFNRPNGGWPRGADWIRFPLWIMVSMYLGA